MSVAPARERAAQINCLLPHQTDGPTEHACARARFAHRQYIRAIVAGNDPQPRSRKAHLSVSTTIRHHRRPTPCKRGRLRHALQRARSTAGQRGFTAPSMVAKLSRLGDPVSAHPPPRCAHTTQMPPGAKALLRPVQQSTTRTASSVGNAAAAFGVSSCDHAARTSLVCLSARAKARWRTRDISVATQRLVHPALIGRRCIAAPLQYA